jgi:hypothetical protein
MSKFDDKSKNIQRAQCPRLITEENNDVADKKFLDAGDNVSAELQTTGSGSGVDGVEKSATQKNSQPRHSSGAVDEKAKGFIVVFKFWDRFCDGFLQLVLQQVVQQVLQQFLQQVLQQFLYVDQDLVLYPDQDFLQ